MNKIYSVLTLIDILNRMSEINDLDMHRFMRSLYIRRVDYLRFTPFGLWGKLTDSAVPYVKDSDGLYLMGEFNVAWIEQLKRLARIAYAWEVSLMPDIMDKSAAGEPLQHLHPYYNNKGNRINGQFDPSASAQAIRNELAGLIFDIIGERGHFTRMNGSLRPLRPNKLSLGNEIFCGKSHEAIHTFGEFVAYPLAHEFRQLGYEGKIYYSANQAATEATEGYVGSEGGWQSEFKIRDTCQCKHNISSVFDVIEKVPKIIHGRWFGISDDGTFGDNPDKQTQKAIVKRTMVLADERSNNNRRVRRLDYIEILPLSIADYPANFKDISKDDLEKFTITSRCRGLKNPNRTVPKWLLRRHGL